MYLVTVRSSRHHSFHTVRYHPVSLRSRKRSRSLFLILSSHAVYTTGRAPTSAGIAISYLQQILGLPGRNLHNENHYSFICYNNLDWCCIEIISYFEKCSS